MKILITGGAGYIGSHTAVQAIEAGHEIVIVDSLINSSAIAIERIQELTGTTVRFLKGDVRDPDFLDWVFTENEFETVIHFAGLKAVGESHLKPIKYYDTNVNGTIQLINTMTKHGVKKFVFSSSATVYGEDAPVPYVETLRRGTSSSPYGASKAMVEHILEDLTKSDPMWSVVLLRYFNPIGAHPSGRIGEDPKGTPNNLLPFMTQVAAGKRDKLSVYGNNYQTKDGTCERDYLHVMDLAEGHLCALESLVSPGCQIYNLGTGKAVSVKEMIESFERANNVKVPYHITERRQGDLAAFWADPTKASEDLKWASKRTLTQMLRDAWNWQNKNPNGYKK